jgi:hypothetical protein
MDGVTQDQMRARLFPFSLLRKASQWFYCQPAETVHNWDTLMRAFMKEYYSPGVGVSYVVTKFATMPESLLVYYTITDKSASARIPL